VGMGGTSLHGANRILTKISQKINIAHSILGIRAEVPGGNRARPSEDAPKVSNHKREKW